MIKFFRILRKKLVSENKFSKYVLYAVGEIILVVIGILIALQVNNWNSDRINSNRVKQYSKSLIQDLLADIDMINVSQFQAKKSYEKIDSLRQYFLHTPVENLSNTDLFVLTHDIMYRPYLWSRSTFDEMKNAEIFQYFKNDSLKKMLIAYETFSYHLDEDFQGDVRNTEKATEMMNRIIDLNSSYFKEMNDLELESFNDSLSNLFRTDIYKNSKFHDLPLLSYDTSELNQFLNAFIQLQPQLKIRGFVEMKNIKNDAQTIIQMLERECKK